MKSVMVIMLLLFWLDSDACSCISSPELDSIELNRYSLVAKGRIIKVKTDNCIRSMIMKVDILYKGSFDKDSLVSFFSDCTTCGLTANVGEKWLIFAYQWQDKYSTDICTRSVKVQHLDTSALHYDFHMARLEKDLIFLNSIYKPLSKKGNWLLPAIIGVGALIIVAGVVYKIRSN